MNVQLPVQMDKPSFLAWVQGREERYELAQGRVVMMTGGSRAHVQISTNLFRALDSRINPDQWTILPDFGVDVGPGTIRYPDIVVDPATDSPRDLTATAPILIAEVLSPSAERVDLGDKAAEYLQLRSLMAYLVFAQDECKAWVWMRSPNEFAPGAKIFDDQSTAIPIAALGIELPLAEVYARVKLD
jgi:Uma2 family endonuclease